MSVTLRKKPLKDGRKSLYLDIYSTGERNYEFLDIYLEPGTSKETRDNNKEKVSIAENIRNKRERELINNDKGLISKYKGEVLVTEYIDYFKKVKKKDGKHKSDSTRKLYESVKLMVIAYDEKIRINKLDEKWIEGFKDFLLAKISHNSTYIYLAKIDAILSQAVKEKIILQNPCKFTDKLRAEPTITEDLTEEDLISLKKTPCKSEILKKAFLFACFTGLRVSDIKKLLWSDIEHSKNFGCRIKIKQTKTGEPTYLPINETALSFIGEAPEDKNQKIFTGGLNTTSYNTILELWFLKAGITKKPKFHLSRHSYAVLLGSVGEDIYTISKLLGHASVDITAKKYAKVIDKRKIEAVNKLPKI
jgi:integrase